MMKTVATILGLVIATLAPVSADSSEEVYPTRDGRRPSPGNTSYYIDPAKGDDSNSGLGRDSAWRSFGRVNQLLLAAGDKLRITSPGSFDQTLMLMGAGTPDAPVEVSFAPGQYDFHTENLCRRKFQISNTNSDPDGEKRIALYLLEAKHVNISGPDAAIVCHGKMIEACIDHCADVTVSGLSFDYAHPTVAEYKIEAVGDGYVDMRIHKDSQYIIDDGQLTWKSDGWSFQGGLGQELNLETEEVRRRLDPLKGLRMEEIEPNFVRATGNHKMKAGHIYQIRDPFRDYAGVFTRRSKDIAWKDVHFRFLHGMGLVNQFSENLTFDGVKIAPDPASGRTTAAWADCIQVSGCKGKLLVKDCVFSGAHDDAINVHGTHLRVIEKVSEFRARLQFRHEMTFGFMAYNPGDDVEFIRWDTLEPYSANKVVGAKLLNPKEMLITLENPFPADFKEDDALENITWTPEVEIRGCTVSRIPTRGFLITTRQKVVVEDNTFNVTHMSAILLENDARGWFESGCVRDMTIRNNRFLRCAEPVININPQNGAPNKAVHQNIRIEGNHFALRDKISVKGQSTTGLTVTGNTIYADPVTDDASSVKIIDCAEVEVGDNVYLPLAQWK